MHIAVVTDELKLPFSEALTKLGEWGVERVEVRGLDGGRVPDGDVDGATAGLREHGIAVTSLSPGVFKCACEARQIEDHIARFRRTLRLCESFRCSQIIAFSMQTTESGENPPSVVVEALQEVGRAAADYGVRIAIENEPDHFAVGCRRLAGLINAVGMSNVGANWDPGNAYSYDKHLDDAVEVLGEMIFNVHVKDTWVRDGKRGFDAVGKGNIDWRRQFRELARIDYQGHVVIETHCEPGTEKTRESLSAVQKMLRELAG